MSCNWSLKNQLGTWLAHGKTLQIATAYISEVTLWIQDEILLMKWSKGWIFFSVTIFHQ